MRNVVGQLLDHRLGIVRIELEGAAQHRLQLGRKDKDLAGHLAGRGDRRRGDEVQMLGPCRILDVCAVGDPLLDALDQGVQGISQLALLNRLDDRGPDRLERLRRRLVDPLGADDVEAEPAATGPMTAPCAAAKARRATCRAGVPAKCAWV
jgi:hypothetical protein